jgi:AmmeMemoRadiSam system protein A
VSETAFAPADRQRLLALARESLEARVRRAAAPPADLDPPLDLPCGAFVSIHRGPALRGCLGRITCDLPLGRVVSHLAQAVAESDPRFPPVRIDELAALSIEISVLTPECEARPADIEIGRHGLIVERGLRRGLLLPQVAADHCWDATTFLEHTCLKAGLAPDAWKDPDTRLLVFEAEVFGESCAALDP